MAIFILFIYCILTGSSVPVIRATIMSTILLLGYIIRRKPDIYNCLSLAALIILFINPWQIFQISFQLSFLSVVSLGLISPKIYTLFSNGVKKAKYLKVPINLFCASLGAWLGLLPFIFYHFKIISPITVLANMVVVPYMTIVIACGFGFSFIRPNIPTFASFFSPVCEISILFLMKFVSLLNCIPFGHFLLP